VNLFFIADMPWVLSDDYGAGGDFFAALLRTDPQKAYPLLLRGMDANKDNTAIVSYLGTLGNSLAPQQKADIPEKLIAAASEKNAAYVFASLEELGADNAQMRRAALKFTGTDDGVLRSNVIAVLGRYGDAAVVPVLLNIVREHPESAGAVAMAIESLRNDDRIIPGDNKILQALIDAVSPGSYDQILKTMYKLRASDGHYLRIYSRMIDFPGEAMDAHLKVLQGTRALRHNKRTEYLLAGLLSAKYSLPVVAGAAAQLIRFYPQKRLQYARQFAAVLKTRLSPEDDAAADIRALLSGTFAGRFALRVLQERKQAADPALDGHSYFRFFSDGGDALVFSDNNLFHPGMDTFIVAPLPQNQSPAGMADISGLSRRPAVYPESENVLLNIWAMPAKNGGHAWNLWYKRRDGGEMDAAFRAQASLAVAKLVNDDPLVRKRLKARGAGFSVTFADADEELHGSMSLPGGGIEDPAFADTMFFVSRPGTEDFEDAWDEVRQRMITGGISAADDSVRYRKKVAVSVEIDPAVADAARAAVMEKMPLHLKEKMAPAPSSPYRVRLAKFSIRWRNFELPGSVLKSLKDTFDDTISNFPGLDFTARGVMISPSGTLALPVYVAGGTEYFDRLSASFEDVLGENIIAPDHRIRYFYRSIWGPCWEKGSRLLPGKLRS
jgi:hypothetical protein